VTNKYIELHYLYTEQKLLIG